MQSSGWSRQGFILKNGDEHKVPQSREKQGKRITKLRNSDKQKAPQSREKQGKRWTKLWNSDKLNGKKSNKKSSSEEMTHYKYHILWTLTNYDRTLVLWMTDKTHSHRTNGDADYKHTWREMGNRWTQSGIREDNQTGDTWGRARHLKREES